MRKVTNYRKDLQLMKFIFGIIIGILFFSTSASFVYSIDEDSYSTTNISMKAGKETMNSESELLTSSEPIAGTTIIINSTTGISSTPIFETPVNEFGIIPGWFYAKVKPNTTTTTGEVLSSSAAIAQAVDKKNTAIAQIKASTDLEVNEEYENILNGLAFSVRIKDPENNTTAGASVKLQSIASDVPGFFFYPDVKVFAQSHLLPKGVDRVGGDTSSAKSGDHLGSVNATVAVIDTGVDLTHPNLNVDRELSKSFIGLSPNDDNGHGTHVAGIIAARDDVMNS